MRTRWTTAIALVLVGVGASSAQPVPPAAAPARQPVQGQLPPLLPVPAIPDPPLAEVPRPGPAPGLEYDPGYHYLPESVAERRLADATCGPLGRWWVTPSLELAWVPTRPAPANVRLRVLDPVSIGGTLPGPVIPVAGRSAGRFEAALGLVVGRWFGEGNIHGVEASFFLRDASNTFGVFAPDTVLLFPRGRRHGDVHILGFPSWNVVSAFPVTLNTFFTTVDVNYRRNLFCSDNARLDGLLGYRYAHLSDQIYVGDRSDDPDDYRNNRAEVSSNFHGAQIGLAGEYRANGWYVASAAKIAFGGTTAEVDATGAFVGAEGRQGGSFRTLRALRWDEESEFAVMPTFNVQLGRQVTSHARVFVGYSFLYLSRAARLGDALDPRNTGVKFTDFWVQSISLGAEFRF